MGCGGFLLGRTGHFEESSTSEVEFLSGHRKKHPYLVPTSQ